MLVSRWPVISSFLVVFLLSFCCAGFPARAQVPLLSWADHYGGSGQCSANDVALDGSDNIVLTGGFTDSVNFGGMPLVSAGTEDVFLAKFNAGGAFLWSRSFGDASIQYALGVTVDNSGNIILTGAFFGAIDFGTGPLTSSGQADIYVAKFDALGNVIWARNYGDAESQYGSAIEVDGAGNIFLSGYFMGTANFGGGPLTSAGDQDIFLVKFDPDGNHLWSHRFGDDTRQYGRSLAVDGSGNVILTGYHQGSVDFGDGPLTNAGSFDAFIAKFDPGGDLIWSAGFGDADRQYTESVAVDDSGNVIVSGFFLGTLDFGGEPLISLGGYDICLAKFDSSGNHLWSDSYGDSSEQLALGLAVDSSGDIIVTGYHGGTLDFGGGSLASAGPENFFIAKFDAGGNHVWSLGTGDEPNQEGRSVAVDGSDSVIATGFFGGTVDFGGGPLVADGIDIFAAKFSRTPSGVMAWPGREQPALYSYPNPFNPTTTITYSVPRTGWVSLRVYDVQGRLVNTLVNGTKTTGAYAVPWGGHDRNGSEVGSGVYFLRLDAAGLPQTFKLVTVK